LKISQGTSEEGLHNGASCIHRRSGYLSRLEPYGFVEFHISKTQVPYAQRLQRVARDKLGYVRSHNSPKLAMAVCDWITGAGAKTTYIGLTVL